MKKAPRKSPDLTIRLSPEERREIDRAAAAEHLSSSTWLRRLALLSAEEGKRLHAQRVRMARLASEIRSGALPDASAHAGKVARERARAWNR